MPAVAESTRLRAQDLPEGIFRVSAWRGPADVARTWLLIALVVGLCGAIGGTLAYAASIVVIAALQNHLMVLFHHSIHNNMHPLRRVNDWIARWLLISPMGQPWGMMHRAHLTHHAYLGKENDPDRWYYDLDLHGRQSPLVLVLWLAANCLGGLVIPQFRKMFTGLRDAVADPGTALAQRDRVDRLAIAVAQGVLFLTFWGLGAWWTYFALWALPAATLGTGLNCFRTTLEHADPSNPPHLNYSFRSNPLERFFVAPFRMNYHWEHHVLMTIPYYQMPRLQRWLLERGHYGDGRIIGTYAGRLQEICTALGAAGSTGTQARS